MSVPEATARKGFMAGVLVLMAGLGVVSPVAPAFAVPPTFTAEERALATIQPSVVYIELTATGVLRDKSTLEPAGPMTVIIKCSGLVVNSTGVAVTTSACATPAPQMLTSWAIENLATSQGLTGDARAQFLDQRRDTIIFTGDNPADQPRKNIVVQANTATARETQGLIWPAEAIGPADTNTGLALIRIANAILPAAEVVRFSASTDVLAVKSMQAMGYVPVNAKTLVVRNRTVNVVPKEPAPDDWTFDLEEELAWDSRGGAVTDLNGRAVGILTLAKSGKVQAMQVADAIHLQLAAANEKNELSNTDLLYRQALESYAQGRYGDAVEKFDKVLITQPNEMARTYRGYAAEKQSQEDAGGTSTWLIVVIVVLLVLLLAAAGAILVMLRQRKNTGFGNYPISASPYGSPVGGDYLSLNYPLSAPPAQPVSGVPESQQFGGFPEPSAPGQAPEGQAEPPKYFP